VDQLWFFFLRIEILHLFDKIISQMLIQVLESRGKNKTKDESKIAKFKSDTHASKEDQRIKKALCRCYTIIIV